MRKCLSVIAALCWLAGGPSVQARDSIIEKALGFKEAMVQVKAFRLKAFKDGRIASQYNLGAGVIIDRRGYVVTNLHTIKFAEKIGVTLYNGSRTGARIVHLLPQMDLALLKITTPVTLKAIPFADSERTELGQEVINIGASYYLKNTLSGGRVTGLARSRSDKSVALIQVNIDLYEGDSGGPLLNKKGELLGMMSARRLDRNRASLAVPSNKIKKLYSEHMN